jgi:hypothetical protein
MLFASGFRTKISIVMSMNYFQNGFGTAEKHPQLNRWLAITLAN